jgi:hypothetical protein
MLTHVLEALVTIFSMFNGTWQLDTKLETSKKTDLRYLVLGVNWTIPLSDLGFRINGCHGPWLRSHHARGTGRLMCSLQFRDSGPQRDSVLIRWPSGWRWVEVYCGQTFTITETLIERARQERDGRQPARHGRRHR